MRPSTSMANQPKRAFHTASEPEIKAGQVSDVYFQRTIQILKAKGLTKRVKAEIRLKSFPQADWSFGILAGIEEAAALLEGLPVDVWAMDEGTVFGPHEPVLVIEGTYIEWAEYETALLGFLCQASGIATKAARCKRAAGDRQVISFGARRMHPALAPMIERNAFVGGCDGVAVTKAAELIEADPTGTIPHALVLMFGDTVEALRAFHEVIDPKVRRVALIDTLQDETPEGWWVTGYPWSEIATPEHKRFLDAYRKRWNDYPRQGSVVGYASVYALAEALKKAKSADTDKVIDALQGLKTPTPFGQIEWRALDHQSTMGAYVGQLARKDGKGVMANWRYVDGASVQPRDDEVRLLRKN